MRHPAFNPYRKKYFTLVLLTVCLTAVTGFSQPPFNKAEFAARRAKVFEKIGDSVAVVLANPRALYPLKFRQAPDFFYLTGIEEPEAKPEREAGEAQHPPELPPADAGDERHERLC